MAHITSGLVGASLTKTEPTADFVVGERATGTDGTQWVYVLASGAIAQYDAVGIDENYSAAPLTAAMAGDGWQVGFAQTAFASADYGWVALSGSNINAAVAVNCAADVPLYTTTTAGTLDDATTTTKIDGVVAVTAVGTTAGNVEVIATWPKSTTF